MNYIVDNDAIHWITILRMLFASVGATCIKDFQCWLLHFPLKWWSLLWYLAVLSIGVTQLLGRVTITTIGSITTIASGATSMATGFAFAIGLLTKFTCKFCLVGRCRCACEAKLEEDLGQFILYIQLWLSRCAANAMRVTSDSESMSRRNAAALKKYRFSKLLWKRFEGAHTRMQ